MNSSIRIYNIIPFTQSLGPFNRAAIWLQGCNHHCKGCMSPETHSLTKGKLIPIEKLVSELAKLDNIEGVTISGGEPFLQINELFEFLYLLKKKTKLGVIIYTGYTQDELRKMNNKKVDKIIDEFSDIVIDGKYMNELDDGFGLKGSSNQNVIFVSDRYKEYRNIYFAKSRKVEVVVNGNDVFMIGIPNKELLNKWGNIDKK